MHWFRSFDPHLRPLFGGGCGSGVAERVLMMMMMALPKLGDDGHSTDGALNSNSPKTA